MLFSLRIDETGTDGRSRFTTIGGAVATAEQWDGLEAAWQRKLDDKGVAAFHLKEFDQREPPFAGWSKMKRELFERGLWKSVNEHVLFRSAISIDSAAHSSVKDRMRGIKGFSPDSDYGLCFRYLMFAACEQLVIVDPDCQLSIIAEAGPWASGAAVTYKKVAAMQGRWKPAKHAHRLAGFAALPKGHIRSLEAADFIVGREHERLVANRRAEKRDKVLSHLLSESDLEIWYQGMMREKDARRDFNRTQKSST